MALMEVPEAAARAWFATARRALRPLENSRRERRTEGRQRFLRRAEADAPMPANYCGLISACNEDRAVIADALQCCAACAAEAAAGAPRPSIVPSDG